MLTDCINWMCPIQQKIIETVVDNHINQFDCQLVYQSTLHMCVERARNQLSSPDVITSTTWI